MPDYIVLTGFDIDELDGPIEPNERRIGVMLFESLGADEIVEFEMMLFARFDKGFSDIPALDEAVFQGFLYTLSQPIAFREPADSDLIRRAFGLKGSQDQSLTSNAKGQAETIEEIDHRSNSTTEQYYVDRILNNPEDSEARWAYAGWLRGEGKYSQASLIILQLWLAEMPDECFERASLERQERELLTQHWDKFVPGRWNELLADVRFRGGLVDQVTFDPYDFLQASDSLFSQFPFIRRIHFFTVWTHKQHEIDDFQSHRKDYYVDIMKMPALTRLNALSLRRNCAGDFVAHEIARSPHLSNLTYLDLAENSINDAGAVALANSQFLKKLERIDLRNNPISQDVGDVLRSRFELVLLEEDDRSWY